MARRTQAQISPRKEEPNQHEAPADSADSASSASDVSVEASPNRVHANRHTQEEVNEREDELTTNMGAANSHEGTNSAIRSTATALRDRNVQQHIVRDSEHEQDQAESDRTKSTKARVKARQLRASNKPRRDKWELDVPLDDSTRALRPKVADPSLFSPTRKQRVERKAVSASSAVDDQDKDHAALRRSPRKRRITADSLPVEQQKHYVRSSPSVRIRSQQEEQQPSNVGEDGHVGASSSANVQGQASRHSQKLTEKQLYRDVWPDRPQSQALARNEADVDAQSDQEQQLAQSPAVTHGQQKGGQQIDTRRGPTPGKLKKIKSGTPATRRSQKRTTETAEKRRKTISISVASPATARNQPQEQGFSDGDTAQRAARELPTSRATVPDKIRLSELTLTRGKAAETSPTGGGAEEVESRVRRKRKASATANTKRKRQERDHPDVQNPPEEELDKEAVEEQATNGEGQTTHTQTLLSEQRFYGQWQTLRGVFSTARQITPQELTVRKLAVVGSDCQKMLDTLKNLRSLANEGQQPDSDVPSEISQKLTALGAKVKALHHMVDAGSSMYQDEDYRVQVYTTMLPRLVKVLESFMRCCLVIDEVANEEVMISREHLRDFNRLVGVIVDFASAFHAEKFVPVLVGESPPIVGPVKNKIIAPLKIVREVLSRVCANYDRADQHAREARLAAQRRASAREREEQIERHEDELRLLRDKWSRLHTERIFAEDGFITKAKRDHLRLPDVYLDVDHDGVTFERLQVFTPRVGFERQRIGPSPLDVENACGEPWGLAELHVLLEGLQRYAGLMVFEKIMRCQCGRKGMLRRFNVTQIVSTAAMYREREMEGRGGEVEEWVEKIPVWTEGTAVALRSVLGIGEELDEREDGMFVS